jgi:predicted Ser/Thr protein kinase
MRVQGVLEDNIEKFREQGKYIRTNYAQTFREVQNPAYNRYADVLEAPVKIKQEQPKPEVQAEPKMIKVKLKSTGQTGRVPESEFDPNIYERI